MLRVASRPPFTRAMAPGRKRKAVSILLDEDLLALGLWQEDDDEDGGGDGDLARP
ncbi:hypothetical protein [Sinorhizobium glycinis]|uniref:hypothetical protein n=1 Tax=Sinorhizobium glycinis TaxID=1472378 RepID=UPI00138FDD04|nr:hypothetical protein [Sinorhizobium glycinis]